MPIEWQFFLLIATPTALIMVILAIGDFVDRREMQRDRERLIKRNKELKK